MTDKLNQVREELEKYEETNRKLRDEGKESLFFKEIAEMNKWFEKAFGEEGITKTNVEENVLDEVTNELSLRGHLLYEKELDKGNLGELHNEYEDEYREGLFYKLEEWFW